MMNNGARKGFSLIAVIAMLSLALVSRAALPQGTGSSASADKKAKTDPPKVKADKSKAQAALSPKQPAPAYLLKIIPLSSPAPDFKTPDADEIVKSMGNTTPFSLKARESSAVLIYSPKPEAKLSKDELSAYNKIQGQIDELVSTQSTTLEVPIAEASALGDFVTKISNLNYHDIKVEAAGPDKIRIVYGANVRPERIKAFIRDVWHLSAQVKPDSPVARLFFINAADVVAVLGQNAPAPAAQKPNDSVKPSSAPSPAAPTPVNTGDKPPGASSLKSTDDAVNPVSDNSSSTCGPSGKATTEGANKPAACPGSTNGEPNSPKTSPDKGGGSTSGTADMSSPVRVASLNNDLMVFSDAHPGDDSEVTERKRILAAVDFPRPEVIINTLSFQTSSTNPDTLYQAATRVRHEIGMYNDGLQVGIARAWRYLESQMSTDSFFDTDFTDYLTKVYVADSGRSAAASGEPTTRAANIHPSAIDPSQHLAKIQGDVASLGICAELKYCLGYTSLFHPLRPSLTDMLLAVIASKLPWIHISKAIDVMERDPSKKSDTCTAKTCRVPVLRTCEQRNCKLPESPTCEERDEDELRLHDFSDDNFIFPMHCFRNAALQVFTTTDKLNSLVMPLRAAVASFLFHYKMSQQYPHEFSPYDLSQSAQELNTELNPLVLAFNRDLAAALRPLKDAADPRSLKGNGWVGFANHGATFVNNGILTVRTISGKETTVDTITQSFFDATNPPSITDIVNSIGSAESNIPKVLKTNLTANEAAVIIGALNSVKPSVSKVGREFKIDIIPRSLSGASAAELDINMTTQEQADPTLYSNGKTDADNLSRVGQHSTQTKVRLESAKLFEISSFTAMLQRSRRNFPLLPPFVEIPYLGSVFSIPLPGAKEYHGSTAIMSAVVVPTAADLASGLVFSDDLIATEVEPGTNCQLNATGALNCNIRKAISTSDFGAFSIRSYNRAMVSCFGSGVFFPSAKHNHIPCGQLNLNLTVSPEDAH